jgi:hypothetical protein
VSDSYLNVGSLQFVFVSYIHIFIVSSIRWKVMCENQYNNVHCVFLYSRSEVKDHYAIDRRDIKRHFGLNKISGNAIDGFISQLILKSFLHSEHRWCYQRFRVKLAKIRLRTHMFRSSKILVKSMGILQVVWIKIFLLYVNVNIKFEFI